MGAQICIQFGGHLSTNIFALSCQSKILITDRALLAKEPICS